MMDLPTLSVLPVWSHVVSPEEMLGLDGHRQQLAHLTHGEPWREKSPT